LMGALPSVESSEVAHSIHGGCSCTQWEGRCRSDSPDVGRMAHGAGRRAVGWRLATRDSGPSEPKARS
jgi:hypothetical protein